jgi:DNA-binding transcriptional MerR regulator
MGIPTHMQSTYSTAEVAREIGVSKNTVLRWLATGKLREPKRETFGGVESRVWSAADLERARAFREEHYRKRLKIGVGTACRALQLTQ